MNHGLNHLAQKRERVGLVLTGARIEEGEQRRRSTPCSGGGAAGPSSASRWRTGRGRVDGSLSVCSGGSDVGSSYEATKRVSMAGIGSTAGSNDEELTAGGRAELQRWDSAALDSRGN